MLLCSDSIQVECDMDSAIKFILSLCEDIENFYIVNDKGEKLVPRIAFDKKECLV